MVEREGASKGVLAKGVGKAIGGCGWDRRRQHVASSINGPAL